MTDRPSRAFYRVVKTNPPTLADFTSPEVAGKPFAHPDPARRHLWDGLSFHATEAQARRNSRRFRAHGGYVAGVRVKVGAPNPRRADARAGPLHGVGESAELLARVLSVAPVW